jgi:hypothetical protein
MQLHKNNTTENSDFVISYLNLRKAVGILGIALPVVLISVYPLLNKGCRLPPSISHYYYTNMGTFFTGTLCAVAMFLFSYKGPERKDEIASTIAAACAVGVAFCPINPSKFFTACSKVFLEANAVRNAFHYGFAALLFLTLAYFSLFLFTKTSDPTPTPQKFIRNKIYISCGCIILISLIAIAVLTIMDKQRAISAENMNIYTFIFETIALFAFGFSWLVKGGTILKDQSPGSFA